jgi:hypothetical protein
MLTPAMREQIREMHAAFRACYYVGEYDPYKADQYICFRLDDLTLRGSISRKTARRCKNTIMAALDGYATLNSWWAKRTPDKRAIDMPNTYRQLWLAQIIRDYKELLK